MSESATPIFDEIDNLTFYEPEDLIAAMRPKVSVIQYEGKAYKLQAPNGFQYFNLVNRFPTLQALVANFIDRSVKAIFALKKEPTDAELQDLLTDIAAEYKVETLFDVFLKVGEDAAAAFVAICLGRQGDRTFEKAIQGADNGGLITLFKACGALAFGGRDPADFFTERLSDFVQMGGIQKAARAAQKRKQRVASTRKPNRIAKPVSKTSTAS
ncbi:hypothetical protein [Allorhizobium undicola]|uniref:hypothetical protein n=1 Tax=Allorhizobium undicola TaxID=78527 RepID=UPI00047FF821|nr:hypothetical protein [Allorhizobium undicola]